MSTSTHSITGRHWQTGDWIRVEFDKKQIVRVEPHEPEKTDEQWLAPGLLDLQINGYAGIDFQQPKISGEDLVTACKALTRDGCPRFFLTLITSPWTDMMRRLKHIKALRDSDPYLCDSIVGWHIEGPFLSDEPGYCGAHDVSSMEDPTPEKIRELRAITVADPTLLTMAPERNASIPVINEAKKLGICVSLGHTNADGATLLRAANAGASGFTHLGNACPQQLDRHDNLVFRALDSGDSVTGIIPDGIHVSPTLFRLFHKLIPNDHIYYTSDAMSAAGAVPGRYKIGSIE
ncbi:MAG: N-acetylglucosamine-6-phosphate deacetylase, partial [Verrucomicrobia bacterium]|nr:N-acetylglucosamine-6-phosphate deacetylase [Verrucomicrobiota bacterium]